MNQFIFTLEKLEKLEQKAFLPFPRTLFNMQVKYNKSTIISKKCNSVQSLQLLSPVAVLRLLITVHVIKQNN